MGPLVHVVPSIPHPAFRAQDSLPSTRVSHAAGAVYGMAPCRRRIAACTTKVIRAPAVRHAARNSIGAMVLPVASRIHGTRFWAMKPPRLPTELMAASPAAAEAYYYSSAPSPPLPHLRQRQDRPDDSGRRGSRAQRSAPGGHQQHLFEATGVPQRDPLHGSVSLQVGAVGSGGGERTGPKTTAIQRRLGGFSQDGPGGQCLALR